MPRTPTATHTAPLTALVLQGGGALGAYQAGAYEALVARAQTLDWVAGISIGAINAALIAGNPPQRRVDRLRAFWERVSLAMPVRPDPDLLGPARGWWDNAMALWGAMVGVPGFFAPRPPLAWWPQPPASWYDTSPLHDTLLELVDFDLLNDGPMRFSVGAVGVESGNFTYFDNQSERIGPEHVMASGALPPGFAAVPIGDRWYWDGGLVSNTPLTYVMDHLDGGAERPVTVFQIDLFNARGRVPETLADAAEREKDIRYSSRTRHGTQMVEVAQTLRTSLKDLIALLPGRKLPPHLEGALSRYLDDRVFNIVHLIYQTKPHEQESKDYAFGTIPLREHWDSGMRDMARTLQHPAYFALPDRAIGVATHDVHRRHRRR